MPSDIALRLPGCEVPTILLRDRRYEPEYPGGTAGERPLIFCSNVRKAHSFLQERGADPGPVQSGGGAEYFELQDREGNLIEVCTEP